MSASESEGGQDDDDVLGFPGDGCVDKTDANPDVFGEQDEEGDDSRMDETGVQNYVRSGRAAGFTRLASILPRRRRHTDVERVGTGEDYGCTSSCCRPARSLKHL